MKVAPSFGYRRSLRRGVARGNVYMLTICKFAAGLNDSMLVQSSDATLNGRLMFHARLICEGFRGFLAPRGYLQVLNLTGGWASQLVA